MHGRQRSGRVIRELLVALAVIALPCAGCSGRPPGAGAEEAAGALSFAIQVAPGFVVDRVDYTVTGNGVTISDHVDTSDPNAAVSFMLQLAAGSGYLASLSAVSESGVHCAGSQTFSVVAHQTSTVFVSLNCDAQNDGDSLRATLVNGTFVPGNPASCPDVAFYSVSPLVTRTGSPFTLDGGGTAGTTTTAWTADQGTIIPGARGAATFVCAVAGSAHLTFTVTDGKSCADSQTITVTCTNSGVCGNGVIEAGEECDDGNTVSGDGCSSTCVIDDPCGDGVVETFAGEQCEPPGTATCNSACHLAGPCEVCEAANCGGPSIYEDCATGVASSACLQALQCSRQNHCYGVDPAFCYCGPRDIVACQGDPSTPGNGPIGPCVTLYDQAAGPPAGATNVLLALTDPATPLGRAGFIQECDLAFCVAECIGPSPCGNGSLDAGEACDDGNTTSLDGCSATCQVEATCGDGHLDPGEGCDDGNTQSGDGCSMFCAQEPCGNGVIDAGETCDDHNVLSGDGCSSTCHIEPACGNHLIEPPETCDPPTPGFCSPTCATVAGICGDGIVQSGEQCDDGNTANGDGCTVTCTFERPASCGDGIVQAGEHCEPPGTAVCDDTCHLGGACTTCEENNCGGSFIHTDCTGGANAAQCIAAIQCARANHCYELDPANCYCGAHDLVACQTATPPATNGPVGPCVAEFTAAASSPAAAQVLLDLTDPSTVLGRAGFMMMCDQAFCTTECF